MMDEIR